MSNKPNKRTVYGYQMKALITNMSLQRNINLKYSILCSIFLYKCITWCLCLYLISLDEAKYVFCFNFLFISFCFYMCKNRKVEFMQNIETQTHIKSKK